MCVRTGVCRCAQSSTTRSPIETSVLRLLLETLDTGLRCFALTTPCPCLLIWSSSRKTILNLFLETFLKTCGVFGFLFWFLYKCGFFSRFCIVPIMYWIHATAVSCPNCILYYAYEINLEFYRHVALSFWPCLICWPAAAAVWQMSGNTRSWWINEGIVLILDALASAHTQTQAPWVHIFPPPFLLSLHYLSPAAHQYSSRVGDVA